jgi:hypothetical protein
MIAAQNSTFVASRQNPVRAAVVQLLQGRLLQRLGDLEAGRAEFTGGTAQHARAWVLRAVHPVTEAHQALTPVQGALDVRLRVPRPLDLLDHAEDTGGRPAVQRPRHGADGTRQSGRDIRARGRDHTGGEGGGVHAVLGGGRPVGVDGGHVLGIGLAPPADHEPLDHGLRLVDLTLRHHRQTLTARRLGDVRQGHHGRTGQIVPGLLDVDVQQRFQAPHRREHGQRRLDVHADVTGVHRNGERLGGRQSGIEGTVDEQPPHVAEGDMADQVLDVDAPVAEGAALLVRFGDLRFERDDSFESGYEVGHQAAPHDVCDRSLRSKDSRSRAVTPVMPGTAGGHPIGMGWQQHNIPECHLWGVLGGTECHLQDRGRPTPAAVHTAR